MVENYDLRGKRDRGDIRMNQQSHDSHTSTTDVPRPAPAGRRGGADINHRYTCALVSHIGLTAPYHTTSTPAGEHTKKENTATALGTRA